MKIFVQERGGNYNLEQDFPRLSLAQIVDLMRLDGGYYTQDGSGRQVFVPWHCIEFIRMEAEADSGVPAKQFGAPVLTATVKTGRRGSD